MVVPTGSLPWSDEPRRSEKNGSATSTTTAKAATAGRIGRRWMNAAHRGQNPAVPEADHLGVRSQRGSFFWRRLRTRGPMKPRKAGSRVRAAIMVNATPMAAATASP